MTTNQLLDELVSDLTEALGLDEGEVEGHDAGSKRHDPQDPYGVRSAPRSERVSLPAAHVRQVITGLRAGARAHELANVVTGLMSAVEAGQDQLQKLRKDLETSGCEPDTELVQALELSEMALRAARKVCGL
jgi:hypothetical protein